LRGLRREDAADNPFLQHVLLGCYLTRSAPHYLRASSQSGLELVLGSRTDVPRLERFQLYSLSNICDWADDRLPTEWGQLLASVATPGSAVLIRQLNNRRDVRRFFAPAFQFDEALGATLQASDRSLFYERIEVGFRR
jgi:S-adenosylmethionine-diacylglycerol 3-amino-3-carboxypropyl transferase